MGRILGMSPCTMAIMIAILSSGLAAMAEDAVKETTSDEDSIANLIQQLDSDSFRSRAEATEKLISKGEAAISALTEASKSSLPEVAMRARDILKILKKPELMTTSSGLKYRILKASTGTKPTATSTVTVHYKGSFADGNVFDSSYDRKEPATFPLNGVIKGWTEGMQLVGEGGVIQLEIPHQLGYGERGAGRIIPPRATLHFQIELIKVK